MLFRSEDLTAPADPFAPGRDLRWVSVRDKGVMLVSVGQDGVAEMPLPGVPMDGPPMHDMAKFALTGYDQRLRTYDPTNGSLGLGDVVRWVGRKEYSTTFEPLFDAWDEAHDQSPYNPTVKARSTAADPDPQSHRDAQGAERLLGDEDYLAALALATRGLNELESFEAEWSASEVRLNLTRGIALYHLGAYREAADALNIYLSYSPNDALGHYYIANALWRGGNRGAAMEHMSAAAQIDPNANFVNTAQAALEKMMSGGQPTLIEPWIVKKQREEGEKKKREEQLQQMQQGY